MRFLLAALLLIQASNPSQAQTGSVAGTLSMPDGAPAAGVRVSLMLAPASDDVAGSSALVGFSETDRSGRYRIENVSPGRYYALAGLMAWPTYFPGVADRRGATAIQVTPRAAVTLIDFRLQPVSRGLQIRGKVTGEGDRRPDSSMIVMLNGASAPSQSAGIARDGAFAFDGLPPGSYRLAVAPVPGYRAVEIVLSDKDAIGIELPLPKVVRISGTVVVEGDGLRPHLSLSFIGGNGDKTYDSVPLQAESGVDLPEGVYAVVVSSLPPGYYVKSIMTGSTNLLESPIRLFRDTVAPIVLSLGVSSPAPWVRLSGRIAGLAASAGTPIEIALDSGPLAVPMEAVVQPDGTFDFPKLLPGRYVISLNGTPFPLGSMDVLVPQGGLRNVELRLPPPRTVRGRVEVSDGGPVPRFALEFTPTQETLSEPATALAQFLAPNFMSAPISIRVSPESDGTFEAVVPEGTYRIAAQQFSNWTGQESTPYILKTLTYGSIDLLSTPMNLASANAELRLAFAPRSARTPSKVSGRLVGRALGGMRGATVQLLASEFVSTLTANVKPDGTFEFVNVYPGTYSLAASGSLVSFPKIISVSGKDIGGLEIEASDPVR